MMKLSVGIVLIYLELYVIRQVDGATTEGPSTTTQNPCFVMYGCANGADCDASGNCLCKAGFTGVLCGQSELVSLSAIVQSQVPGADLTKAAEFATEAQTMMDNQLSVSYTNIKTSVTNVNSISTAILSIIENDDSLADQEVVDLYGLTQDMTEMTTDVLQGTKQAEASMTTDELKVAVLKAEENLLTMTNLMLDKRPTDNTTSSAIDTAEMSVRVIKAKGADLPPSYEGRDAGMDLPYYETFQDKEKKKNVSINVVSYTKNPYLHLGNNDEVGSSVIKLQILDKKGKEETKIKDDDDPINVYVNTDKLNTQNYFEDMTESRADAGVYMSYVDTEETAEGFMFEVKLRSLKICDLYAKYDSYPDKDSFDIWIQTKGKSRIKDKQPIELRASFQNQVLKITLPPDKGGVLKPLVVTVSCEDDRADTARRRRRSGGISLVQHQFRTGLLTVKTMEEDAVNWTSSDKLKDIGADGGRIQFKSQFFGTFSADMFFIGPTPIDFSKLFANFIANLQNSPYALAAIVAILCLFAFLTVPLYRADRRDAVMWSYLPLIDNRSSAHVTYLIAVETSVRSAKVMKSTIYINIIGEASASGTRKLDDGKRQNFGRGTSSHFEIKVRDDLGKLKTLQIWHDNKDGKTTWILQKVTVIKAESGERYTFLCGKSLSLDSEDGKIWRTLDALDPEHVETKTLFNNLSQKKLFDDHLWVSLFKRPRFSRFTRVQRLWCLAALLFLAMIASAMWYDTPEDQPIQTISLGPLKLSYKQFYVGIMSSAIALVPSMILVLIFRNRKFKGEHTKGCHVPWWSIFFAYFLILACVGASGTFVFFYSLQWGGDKSLEWMVSFVLAIFQSVIILEPIKAIALAVLVACMCKKIGSNEMADKEMVIPKANKQDISDVETTVEPEPVIYPLFPGYQQDSDEQVVARIQAQLDKRLWTKLKQWLGIFLYVVLIATICAHSSVTTQYLQNKHLQESLSTVFVPNTTDEIYDWIMTTFTRAVYPKWWETEEDELLRPAYVQWFQINAYNYRITRTRLRQVRVKGDCVGPDITQDAAENCYPSFNSKTEDKDHHCLYWEPFNATGCFDENEEFQYSFLYNFGEGKNAGDMPYFGKYGKYGPDGYYVDLGPKQSLVTQYTQKLREAHWIDKKTRAVFLDVMSYNANTRLFSHIKVVFELPTIGGVAMTTVVWSANLYPYIYAIDYLILFLQIIFIVVLFVRFVLLLVDIWRKRTSIFFTVGFYLYLLEITFGVASIVCCILRIDATISSISKLKMTFGRYASFELVRVYDALYNGSLGGLLFILILYLLKPLEFNYHFFMLISALKIARGALFAFMFIIFLEVVAFASLLHLYVGRQYESFKSMPESLYTLVQVLLAMITYDSEHFQDVALKVFFGFYALSVTITLVNVFIVLLTISFNEVKTALDNGELQFDEKMNVHFWDKFFKILQWIRERFCLFSISRKDSDLKRLRFNVERLEFLTKLVEKDEKVNKNMAAKLMLKMIEIDSNKTVLQCLNVQRNMYSTKYVFGEMKSGEVFLIINVPHLSCKSEIETSCQLIQNVRREASRKLKCENTGNGFTLTTINNDIIKGSIQIEIVRSNDKFPTNNTIVARMNENSPWTEIDAIKTSSSLVASFPKVPTHICTVRRRGLSNSWNPLETYRVDNEGGCVFPSYDPGTQVLFPKDSFRDSCNVSMRTKPGSVASAVNVVLELPTNKPVDIQLQRNQNIKNNQNQADADKDHLADYIICRRNKEDGEWSRLNSTLKTKNDVFQFPFSINGKQWKYLEITVKESEIDKKEDMTDKSKKDIELLKAISMVSQIKEVASKWKQLALHLGITEAEIKSSEPSSTCKEEKCYLLLKKWAEKSDVSFTMLTCLLTTFGHRIIADNVRRRWIINSPKRKNDLYQVTNSLKNSSKTKSNTGIETTHASGNRTTRATGNEITRNNGNETTRATGNEATGNETTRATGNETTRNNGNETTHTTSNTKINSSGDSLPVVNQSKTDEGESSRSTHQSVIIIPDGISGSGVGEVEMLDQNINTSHETDSPSIDSQPLTSDDGSSPTNTMNTEQSNVNADSASLSHQL